MSHLPARHASNRIASIALALTAFFGLTGAKGGCFGDVVHETPVPTECAPGETLVEVCAEPLIGCLAEEGCPEIAPICELQCAPAEDCGPGFHIETVCEAFAAGMPDCPPDTDCAVPPPSEPVCHDQCVPDDVCGPGFHVETVCEDAPVEPHPECAPGEPCPLPCPPAPVCSDQCVPDACPPGHREEVYCTGACPPDFEGPCESSCERVCVSEGGGSDPEPMPAPKD
jgi:hypothetical protein